MSPTQRYNYRLLTGIIALVYAGMGISAPLLALFLEELGADYGQIAQILTTFAVIFLLSNYLWGRVTDRWGRRKALMVGGLLGVAGLYMLLSRAPSLGWAWTLRGLQGIALAAYMTPSLALMGAVLQGQGQRGRSMGAYRGLASLAFAGAAVVGGRIADTLGIGPALALCGILYGLAGLTALAVREARATPTPQAPTAFPLPGNGGEPLAAPTAPAGGRLPWPFLAGVGLWMTAHVAGASVWPNFMASLGYTKSAITALWGLAALVEFPAMSLAGSLSDMLGRIPVLAVGGLGVALVSLGYLTLARIFPGLLGVQVVRGFAFAAYTATAMVFAAEWGPEETRGRNTGLFHAVSGMGQVLGNLLGGTLAQTLGFGWLYAICAGLGLAAAASFAMGRRTAPVHTAMEGSR